MSGAAPSEAQQSTNVEKCRIVPIAGLVIAEE
jgi:hypothetical protein